MIDNDVGYSLAGRVYQAKKVKLPAVVLTYKEAEYTLQQIDKLNALVAKYEKAAKELAT